jgi:MFS family permease
MLENFSRSLQSIFDLYKEKRNSYFGFSFSFGMLSLFVSGILSLLICYAAKELFEWEGSEKPIYEDVIAIKKWNELLFEYFVLSFGAYAIYLRKLLFIKSQQSTLDDIYDSVNQKPSMNELFDTITSKNQTTILSVLVVISIIYIAFFKYLFGHQGGNLGMLNDVSMSASITKSFLLWLNSIFELLKQYLPYFGAFYIFMADYDSSFSLKGILKYRKAFITFLLMSFCIISISESVQAYIDVYIINFITIPIQINFIKGILQIFIYVFTSAFFYLGFAASILYPVVNQHEVIDSN